MPPSVNKLYTRTRHGGRALTKEAHRFREHVKKVVSRNLAEVSMFPSEDQELTYGVDFTFWFSELENPGWFKSFPRDSFYQKDSKAKGADGKPKHKKGELKHRMGERMAKTRYKQIDVDNRLKFIQDCLVECLGIPDDSQIFKGSQKKMRCGGLDYVDSTIFVTDRGAFFPEGTADGGIV